MAQGRFHRRDVRIGSDRVANLCSKPDCRKLTIGPTKRPTGVSVIGEGAHIRGRRPDKARHDPSMTDAERADPANMIWLCRDHHKLVDDDETYSVAMLEEWRAQAVEHAHLVFGTPDNAVEVYDCPWCGRLIPQNATHCAHCPNVHKAEDPLVNTNLFLSCALAAVLLRVYTWHFDFHPAVPAVCMVTSVLTVGLLMHRHAEWFQTPALPAGQRFVREDLEPDGNSFRTVRTHRFAKSRTLSALELSRQGLGGFA